MKLLIDQNLSPSLTRLFNNSFDEIVHIKDVGLETSDDFTAWEYARSNGYTIVTKDNDFNGMVSLFGFPPKVIWLRRGNSTTKVINQLILERIDIIKAFITDNENGILTIL
jgi:predicted nuclease of predicted toxin-antitoxin system